MNSQNDFTLCIGSGGFTLIHRYYASVISNTPSR